MTVLGFYGEGLYFKEDAANLNDETEVIIRQLLAANHGVGIIGGYYEPNLPICMISELALKMLGYDTITDYEKVAGEHLLNIVNRHGQKAQLTEENFAMLIGELHLHLCTKQGGSIWVRMVKHDLALRNGRKLWMLSVCDFDEVYKREQELIKAKEEAERANKAKTFFLSRMSHDMRTPLNGILGMTQIALENIKNETKIEDALKKIQAVSKQLELLVGEMLDLGRLEKGKVSLLNESFDLQMEINKLKYMIDGLDTDIRLVGAHVNMKHPRVIGSAGHLQRVLDNLVSNAIKYNKPGGTIEYWLDEEPCDENTSLYRFVVKDTGVGMSQEFQKHMFEPFLQEEQRLPENQQGLGLGLAITRELVELMGGTIKAESKLGEGSTFTVELPLQIDNTPVEHTHEEMQQKDYLAGIRVLLVDDNAINREIAQYILQQAGAEVDQAADGQQAVERFLLAADNTYQVILMDCVMPVMDGVQATQAIRNSQRAQAESIPIIAMTANAFSDDVLATRDAGMNDHLTKPVDKFKLLQLVKKYAELK